MAGILSYEINYCSVISLLVQCEYLHVMNLNIIAFADAVINKQNLSNHCGYV